MIDNILSNYLNGEPIHDSVIIGVYLGVIFIFYQSIFSAVFSVFKK